MPTISLVLANDYTELPIDSLAKQYEWETVAGVKRIKRIIVSYRKKLYAKELHYDGDGDILHTKSDPGNESEWCRVNS
jgi:hypothetical protein